MLVLTFVLGCARGPEFTSAEPSADGSAIAAAVSTDGLVRETFEVGPSAETPLADYLFVVDGSPSTKKIVDRLRAGFAAVAAEAPFPERARIAVVSTLPGEPGHLATAHRKVSKRSDARFTPGFLAPVDRDAIARWQGFGLPGFAHAGCEAWFGPRDVDANGVPCIIAHTETSKKHGPVEAGLTVLSQLMDKGQVFRDGAAVSVIFVSDTHDPGVPPTTKSGEPSKRFDPKLLDERPTWEQLRDQAAATHSLASFRLHAIAPETECVERWYDLGPAYYTAAIASGGEILDICAAETQDYVRFVRDVAASGDALDRPVVALGSEADHILSVEIDGAPVPWTWGDGRALVLTNEPATGVRVDVTYRPAPGMSAVRPDERAGGTPAATGEGGKPAATGEGGKPAATGEGGKPAATEGGKPATIEAVVAVPLDQAVIRLLAGPDFADGDDTHALVLDPGTGRCASTDVYGGEEDTIQASCRVVAVDGPWTAWRFEIGPDVELVQVARLAELPDDERDAWQALGAVDLGDERWVVVGAGLDRVYATAP